jgi:membrane protein
VSLRHRLRDWYLRLEKARAGGSYWQYARRYLSYLNRELAGWPKVIVKATDLTFQNEAYLAAAAVAYFAFFSLFPLILLAVAVASIWLDPVWAEQYIMEQMEFVAPALGELLGANLTQIVSARRSITGFALITLIWSASTIFYVLTSALDQIWQVETIRPVWRYRGLAILIVLLVCAFLLLATFASSIALTVLDAILPEQLRLLDSFWEAVSSLVITVALFAILYRSLPHIQLRWSDVLPGAVAAGILWEMAKRIFLYFVANYVSASNLVYGSVAAITVFLTWAYFSGLIFLFGAYLNSERKRWLRKERLTVIE